MDLTNEFAHPLSDSADPISVIEHRTFTTNSSCIGWKFAYAELQAFLFEIIGQMEFSPTPETKRIRREAVLIMVPTLEGEVEKGAQMPLRVRVAV